MKKIISQQLLKERLSSFKRRVLTEVEETLKVTTGVGSGTVACRLRNELLTFVREVKDLISNLHEEE